MERLKSQGRYFLALRLSEFWESPCLCTFHSTSTLPSGSSLNRPFLLMMVSGHRMIWATGKIFNFFTVDSCPLPATGWMTPSAIVFWMAFEWPRRWLVRSVAGSPLATAVVVISVIATVTSRCRSCSSVVTMSLLLSDTRSNSFVSWQLSETRA